MVAGPIYRSHEVLSLSDYLNSHKQKTLGFRSEKEAERRTERIELADEPEVPFLSVYMQLRRPWDRQTKIDADVQPRLGST